MADEKYYCAWCGVEIEYGDDGICDDCFCDDGDEVEDDWDDED